MGKFRSKLKRRTKGKKWAHGQSATSNPENNKHRNKARSRFFQPNLSLAPAAATTPSGSAALTLESISKHDARLSYAGAGGQDGHASASRSAPTVNDIAMSLRSINFSDDDMGESQFGTFKTFQTFASSFSACSNMTFNKFLNGFRQTSELHKEMLAILTAITEVIKERNGTESSTEYFLALMETLEAAKQDTEILAILSLLAMGIKSVPRPVLRKKFVDCAPIFTSLMEQFAENENQNALRSIIGCISVILRAVEYSDWRTPTPLKLFNQVLIFVTHTKPKIRKAAQHAITAIIHGCYFMEPSQPSASPDDDGEIAADISDANRVQHHPAGSYVAKFCSKQFQAANLVKSQTVILHTLTLLRDTINGLREDDIKEICEQLLSIMSASKVLIQTNCFHTLHSLFASKSSNLSAGLIAKLIAAIYDYRPEKSDARQTLAWLAVLKEGHICLAAFDLNKCVVALPRFIEIVAGDIWMSENNQIASAASNTLKEILLECVQPVCVTERSANALRKPITAVLHSIAKGLTAPFGSVAKQVIVLYATVFEVAGRRFRETLQGPLNAIAARYDEETATRTQIERTLQVAIKTMGPEAALKAVPLCDPKDGLVNIAHSWILPLLRESIQQSSFRYFATVILPLADRSYQEWQLHKQQENLALARTNELIFCQLWGLFPGFCRDPVDISEFGAACPRAGRPTESLAKILGDHLKENVDTRLPILDGLQELLKNEDDEFKRQMGRFAKNFMCILLDLYVTKPSGSYETDIRVKVMEVIQLYLNATPVAVLREIFATAKMNFKTKEALELNREKIHKLNLALDRAAEEDRQYDADESVRIDEAYELLKRAMRGEGKLDDDEIQNNLRIVPERRMQKLFKKVKTQNGPFVYEACFDIVMSMALYSSHEQLQELFEAYIAPTLRNAKTGGITSSIKERLLKSYELLKNILLSENEGCRSFVAAHVKEIHKLLLGTALESKSNAKVMQLTCILLLIEKELANVQSNSKIVSKTISEVVVSFSQAINKKKENVAVQLLLKVGEIYQREDKINDLVDMLKAGFSGDSVIVSNTIHVLRTILQNFTGNLTLPTLTFVLEQVLAILVGKNRSEVEAAVSFLMVFVKLLPAPYVANHLPNIVKSLSAMVPDTKRVCRIHVGYIYRRLCKRFTAEEIIKLVPGNDEVTHKKLKNIRKELGRVKRQKLATAAADDEKGDDDGDDSGMEGDDKTPITTTIDDILADSDSELENDIMMDDDEAATSQPRPKAKAKRSKEQLYLHEDADTIVDLADVNVMSKISTSKPVKSNGERAGAEKKAKDLNRGFKQSDDGRLIIEEPKRGRGIQADSDSDDEEDDGDNDASDRIMADSDSDDETTEIAKAQKRKRKASGPLSSASGQTGKSGSKYVAGGKGIHRQLGASTAASTRSGYSQASKATTKVTAHGGEYRSKKASGDIKKKNTLDPYAYIPLSRSSLNKRKMAKSSGQFKSIVSGARKGAAAGSKRRKVL